MPVDIVTIPCLSDNYAYLIHGPDGVALIDAPEAGPIIAELDARGWSLDVVLITHHHHDHVGGVAALREKYGCTVMGPEAEQDKLPPLDHALSDGPVGPVVGLTANAMAVPGHTLGHLAYHFPDANAVFTADSLMALGCGRLFEGTPDMMWDSLCRLKSLPHDTVVYSGHEYTASNAKFALTIEPDNPALKFRADEITAKRAQNQPTAQVLLSVECDTNPFLRADQPSVKALMGMAQSTDAAVFAEIRARKDKF